MSIVPLTRGLPRKSVAFAAQPWETPLSLALEELGGMQGAAGGPESVSSARWSAAPFTIVELEIESRSSVRCRLWSP